MCVTNLLVEAGHRERVVINLIHRDDHPPCRMIWVLLIRIILVSDALYPPVGGQMARIVLLGRQRPRVAPSIARTKLAPSEDGRQCRKADIVRLELMKALSARGVK